jgi:N4-(beta-N-acetylglucosaminyl)-L-asparaginase
MAPAHIDRRGFVKQASASLALGVALPVPGEFSFPAPAIQTGTRVKPIVISDWSGFNYRNGGKDNAVERAFRLITEGKDVLDALIEGVNIPELDPEETGIGYGALPNADGIVQLDASCMHGPKKRAGAVAAIEGVRTPSLVAKAVAEFTDNHLLAGRGAQEFARAMGFKVEEDLNTERSRRLFLEWKRRVDPERWLDPESPARKPPTGSRGGAEFAEKYLEAGKSMVRDGLIPEGSLWGTINCDGINANGDICGVTTTSGLAWKIPGRVGDSPILGAGLYVDGDIGAAGSTGRGEANLFGLCSYLVVEQLRMGKAPKDAGMEALRRIKAATIETRLLDARGNPNFQVNFYVLNRAGDFAGVALYESSFAVCTENGPEIRQSEALLPGKPNW